MVRVFLYLSLAFLSSQAWSSTSLLDYVHLKKNCWTVSGQQLCDWSEALQTLIDENDDVYIPPGQFNIFSEVSIDRDNVRISGAGNSSILVGYPGGAILSIVHPNHSSSALGSPDNINNYYRGIRISALSFKPNNLRGHQSVGIKIRGLSDGVIENCSQGGLDKFIDYDAMSTTIISKITALNIRSDASKSNYIIYSAGNYLNNDNTFTEILGYAIRTNIHLDAQGEHGVQDGVTISNSTLWHSGTHNIYIKRGYWTVISGNKLFEANLGNLLCHTCLHTTITNNSIMGTKEIDKNSPAIFLDTQAGYPHIGNIVVANNSIVRPSGHGIYVKKQYGFNINNNVIQNPNFNVKKNQDGVQVASSTPVDTYSGVYIDNSYKGTVAHNTIIRKYTESTDSWKCDIEESQGTSGVNYSTDNMPCE